METIHLLFVLHGRSIYEMILHNYSPLVPYPYCVRLHHGSGLGSVFAKLFSRIAAKTATRAVAKVAAKTAARAALRAAKVAGRKVLKVAAKQGTSLAKKAAKEGFKKAAEFGAEAAVQGIDSLSQKAINKGVPVEAVHNISNFARKGTQAAAHKLSTAAIAKVHSSIDNILQRNNLLPTKRKKTQNFVSTTETRKRKKRKSTYNSIAAKKRRKNTDKSLSTLIEES